MIADCAETRFHTWDFDLPALPVQYISRVEDLRDVPGGDVYVQPPLNFAAIDSIVILGGKAYLVQITQNVKHNISVGLLSVLACLPRHLEVVFVWALPSHVWAQKIFKRKPVPQTSLSQLTDRACSKEQVKTAEGTLSTSDESSEDDTAAERRAPRVSQHAIKELVDKDVALVERRVAACEIQFKMGIPLPRDVPRALSQTDTQGGPQASLSTASSMARSAASAVRGPRPVRFLPGLPGLATAAIIISKLLLRAQMVVKAMQTKQWLHWRQCVQ